MAERYDVTSTRESQELTADGRVLDVIEVGFVTRRTGTSGTVKVPRPSFDPETVGALVEEYVDRIEAVEDL